MKGVIAKEPGGAEQLVYTDMPHPELQHGDLLIKVHAAAVNRTDILNREGKVGYVENPIIGVEISGEVIDPNGNDDFKTGDRVMGLVNGGAYAEYAVMPANRAMHIPDSLSYTDAAAIPEVFLTAYQTLNWIGKLQKNETVLIHAGASGVGTAAIQLAKRLSDAKVIVTAGSERKLEFCRQLGADIAINYKKVSFDQEVLKATDQKGVNVILDFVGSAYWDKNYASIAIDGRWVLIGVLGGSTVKKVRLMDLMKKRVQLTGTLLTPRSDDYKSELTKDLISQTNQMFENGTIKPIVDTIFSIEEAYKAHQWMEQNKNIGKIVLTIN
ncbi:NAD(P)H-quinone oxidoreductase [Gracilibacillus sp. YIM 98692]|uniref:NAD(P)H-quinone oxidoreductase n=1 Tax=Gracilibacillus sp. YIM 98692 TaxID=2663532 RepID=UPI0013D1F8F4|nr:NAD(P)H-quinone oxidoreductase [Gracilibacillus sp. YIM 98692]